MKKQKTESEELQYEVAGLKEELNAQLSEIDQLTNQKEIANVNIASLSAIIETLNRQIETLNESMVGKIDRSSCDDEKSNLCNEFNNVKEKMLADFNGEKDKLLNEFNREKDKLINEIRLKNKKIEEMPTINEIIQDFASDLVALSNISRINAPTPDDMARFRHEDYVNECSGVINDNIDTNERKIKSHNIILFLREILDKCFQKLSNLNPTNNYYGTQLSEEKYNYKYLSTMISSCLKAINPSYISTAAYLTIINVLSISKSALCADFVNWSMCGGVTSQSIYNRFKKLGDIFSKSTIECPMTYEVIAVFDNNSNDYKQRTYRSGLNQGKGTLVWTNVEAYLFAKCRKIDNETNAVNFLENKLCHQHSINLTPQNWPNFSKATLKQNDTIINVTTFGDDSIPNRTSVHPETTLSDIVYMKNEITSGLLYAILLLNDTPKLIAYYPNNEYRATAGTIYADVGQDTDVDDRMQVKECFSCSTQNKKSMRKCGGCSRKLLSIKVYRQHLAQAGLDQVMRPLPLRHRRTTTTKLITLADDGKTIERRNVKISSHTLSVPLDNDEIDLGVTTDDTFMNIIRELLPSIMVNPSSDAEVIKIYAKLGETFNLAGFTRGNVSRDVLRYFIYLVSDFGATNLTAIDTNPNFQNFIHIIGTFHECKSFLELTMDLLFSVGGDILAAKHTFASEKAQAYLRRCGDIHKANDFLRDVAKPAIFISILFEYLDDTTEEGTTPNLDNIKLEDVFEWGNTYYNENNGDMKWKNFWFLFSHVLPAYELIKKGVRTGNMAAYNAGRRALLPFMFSLSKLNYGPLIIRDMIQYYWTGKHHLKFKLN